MLDKIIGNLYFSLQRTYLFLFFNAVYTFLNFWIGTTIFLAFPFTVFGIIFYIFVVFFEKGINGIISKNEELKIKSELLKSTAKGTASIFLIVLIVFAMIYLLGVYWMQNLVINYYKIPKITFTIVNLGLSFLSLTLSFLLSFTKKK